MADNGLVKLPRGHGPIVTPKTHASERANDHARPMDKGNSKPPARHWPPGKNPMPTKHGFMPNQRETI